MAYVQTIQLHFGGLNFGSQLVCS